MDVLSELIAEITRLPGIGPKSARRIVYHLLESPEEEARMLAERILEAREKIVSCELCGRYTSENPCSLCTDLRRNRSVLCIVESPQDVETFIATGAFDGLYHVLGGTLSPMDGIGPAQLRVDSLMSRLDGVEEVIIATNPTEAGNITALYLQQLLAGRDMRITRIASGVPVGGDLEYVDRGSLVHALKGRVPLD